MAERSGQGSAKQAPGDPSLRPIADVASSLGLVQDEVISYGPAKAKVSLAALARRAADPLGRYILVTAINPTPLGEGKTTTAIGLAMGLSRLGHRAAVTLRQPSLGPVFGVKGGGAGGGRTQVLPLADVNLHLTGDSHAVASAHNLLSALVDNHLFHGNAVGLDPAGMLWPRVMGLSDRALRRVRLAGAGGSVDRDGEFILTEASEVMAILALAKDLSDLRARLGRILVGFTTDGRPVTADDLHAAGAMAVLLRDALHPNLVQTSEGTPAFVHAGPFGNIAHGNCSVVADLLALRLADYVVTEAGFGSELGAEKFVHIKCRASGLKPDAAVVVATVRALKLHGSGQVVKAGEPLPASLTGPNREALRKGLANLAQHVANVKAFGMPAVVAINAFPDDSEEELEEVRDWALSSGAVGAAVTRHFMEGGKGAEALAEAVVAACRHPARITPLYTDEMPVKQKIERVATRLYGAAGVSYEPEADRKIALAERLGFGRFPVCMAKTPLSLSHDAALKGRPMGFTLPIKDLRILAGAGFLTAVCAGMQLMPGLPSKPSADRIDLDPATGEITGLF